MTLAALGLILAAAFVHATWNLLAKRAGEGGAPFVWLVAIVSSALYLPAAAVIVIVAQPDLGGAPLVFIAGSGVIHLAYFMTLQRGYREGDLSVVYPLARGTGPVIATAAAIAFFDERPSGLALVGVVLVGGGVVLLARSPTSEGVRFGLLTGVFIASYTLWDKHAVDALEVPPLLLTWGSDTVRVACLAPIAAGSSERLRRVWADHRREVLGVAALTPLGYILVLTALAVTPVSYVAPAREVSVLIGVAFGTRLLAEGEGTRRLTAAAAVALGVMALAIG